jgi:hypothetical protein
MPMLEAIGFMILGSVITVGALALVVWFLIQPDKTNLYGSSVILSLSGKQKRASSRSKG